MGVSAVIALPWRCLQWRSSRSVAFSLAITDGGDGADTQRARMSAIWATVCAEAAWSPRRAGESARCQPIVTDDRSCQGEGRMVVEGLGQLSLPRRQSISSSLPIAWYLWSWLRPASEGRDQLRTCGTSKPTDLVVCLDAIPGAPSQVTRHPLLSI
jgi:hypothetical protein